MNSFLKPNAKIGVFAPSSFVEQSDIDASAAVMVDKGFDVFVHPQTYARHGQSAGSTQEKVDALHALYADQSIDAIWAAGGGNRAMDMLNALDFDLIRKHTKPLIGFSDVTILLNAITAHTGQPNWHAQVFKNLHRFDGLDETLDILSGKKDVLELCDAEILKAGSAQGVLVGGNLSLFHYLTGTKDCPDLNGAILFLEDTGDEISRFDRMFLHMKRMGVFEQIGGLVLGTFDHLGDSGTPFGFDLRGIVTDSLGGRDIPVVMDAPFGHGAHLFPLPIGGQTKLDKNALRIL